MILLISQMVKAQNTDKQVANELVRNMLVYQILNDFTETVPVFFVVPGWYFFSSFQVTQIPVFVDEDYYAELDFKNRKNALHKELFEVLDVNFIPEIPEDKHMEVRLIDSDNLLYRLRFYRNDDTLFLLQAAGKNLDEKLFKIVDNELLEVIKTDKKGVSYQKMERYGDTMRINREYDAQKGVFHISEMRFSNENLLQSKSIYKQRANGRPKLKSKHIYEYADNNLTSVLDVNNTDTVISSTMFTYNLDNLLSSIIKKLPSKNLFSINMKYDDDKLLTKKTFHSDRNIYTLDYIWKDKDIVGLKMNFLEKDQHEFVFDINLQKQLSRIQHLKSPNVHYPLDDKEEIHFHYNANGNIRSIRVIDNKGRINKEISFEYDYFTP
ncbi:MAG: hypothetical protein RBR84_13005 [Bacteroidales bacterium]|nr:hypothetical protein [Bacteroidales bacterium]